MGIIKYMTYTTNSVYFYKQSYFSIGKINLYYQNIIWKDKTLKNYDLLYDYVLNRAIEDAGWFE